MDRPIVGPVPETATPLAPTPWRFGGGGTIRAPWVYRVGVI